jgi:hypothetical protein
MPEPSCSQLRADFIEIEFSQVRHTRIVDCEKVSFRAFSA